ncbi:GntR family transcriptional regulator (plasmid) [Streptomyces sp. BI20]|uniref:GntR family transcriptional regulator n=1 Tax=Streptomyces sp. BI20 TaxID=3403460 RepID=UPI003C76CA52
MIEFTIVRRNGVATYLQIVHQVEDAVRSGALRAGDRLPTAAHVAATTKVNPNTTLKAYRELERMALAEVRQGAGTFITATPPAPDTTPTDTLRAAAEDLLRRAKSEGLTSDQALTLLTTAHTHAYPPHPTP